MGWGLYGVQGTELNIFDGKLVSTLNHVVLEEELTAKRKDPSQKGNFTLRMAVWYRRGRYNCDLNTRFRGLTSLLSGDAEVEDQAPAANLVP